MSSAWTDAFISLPRIWAQNAHRLASKTALTTPEETLDWRELGRRMEQVAAALHAEGLRPGDRVALLAHGSSVAVECLMGVFRAGMTLVPISPLLTPDQAAVAIRDADARALIATSPFERHAKTASLVGPKICHGFEMPEGRDYAAWRDRATPRRDAAFPKADDEAIIIYSSGTTGAPKGIIHSHGARWLFAANVGLQFGIGESSVALLTTPVSSNATALLLLPTLMMGGVTIVPPKFDAQDLIGYCGRAGVTHLFAVPTAIEGVCAAAEERPIAAPALRCVISAGSHLRPDLKRRAVTVFGPVVNELYGCTEGMITILSAHELLERPETVGRAVLGGEIGVLDGNDQLAPPGVTGEVVGRFAGLMLGYNNRPQETADAFWTDRDGRRWFRSGDIGRLDPDGYLTIVDRKKDMILSGGYNVFSADIEAIVIEHPGVKECAVIAVAHQRWGEAPAAVVVGDVEPEELKAWANARLAKHQRLDAVFRTESLPRNGLGKVLKRELRERFARAAEGG